MTPGEVAGLITAVAGSLGFLRWFVIGPRAHRTAQSAETRSKTASTEEVLTGIAISLVKPLEEQLEKVRKEGFEYSDLARKLEGEVYGLRQEISRVSERNRIDTAELVDVVQDLITQLSEHGLTPVRNLPPRFNRDR